MDKYHSIDEIANLEAIELEGNLRMLENNTTFYEILASISYIAGTKNYRSSRSRREILDFIQWTIEFKERYKDTSWIADDSLFSVIDNFLNSKLS